MAPKMPERTKKQGPKNLERGGGMGAREEKGEERKREEEEWERRQCEGVQENVSWLSN